MPTGTSADLRRHHSAVTRSQIERALTAIATAAPARVIVGAPAGRAGMVSLAEITQLIHDCVVCYSSGRLTA